MGCGGSRADTIIEPRYHESWTRETESTWLTNTDIETPVPGVNSKNCCSAEEMSSRMVVENAKYAGWLAGVYTMFFCITVFTYSLYCDSSLQ